MKAIIVDDEQESHNVLKILISKNHPDVEIIGSAYSVKEGLEKISASRPDLVFLDIYLPDGLGFEILDKIDSFDFYLIFFTSSKDHTYRAIKFGALDYLMKPISTQELANAMQRVRTRIDERVSQKQLQILQEALRLLPDSKLPERMGISTIDGVFFKQVKDIIWLEGQGAYTYFHFDNNQKPILASSSLGVYEKQFEPYKEFARAHKSHMVNLTYVDRWIKSGGGYLLLKDGKKLDVSPRYRENVSQKLDQLIM